VLASSGNHGKARLSEHVELLVESCRTRKTNFPRAFEISKGWFFPEINSVEVALQNYSTEFGASFATRYECDAEAADPLGFGFKRRTIRR